MCRYGDIFSAEPIYEMYIASEVTKLLHRAMVSDQWPEKVGKLDRHQMQALMPTSLFHLRIKVVVNMTGPPDLLDQMVSQAPDSSVDEEIFDPRIAVLNDFKISTYKIRSLNKSKHEADVVGAVR
jgi:hypothetical protein